MRFCSYWRKFGGIAAPDRAVFPGKPGNDEAADSFQRWRSDHETASASCGTQYGICGGRDTADGQPSRLGKKKKKGVIFLLLRALML